MHIGKCYGEQIIWFPTIDVSIFSRVLLNIVNNIAQVSNQTISIAG
jgi:hypothetical protein